MKTLIKELNIAHFSSSLSTPLGGAEKYCVEVAREQASIGHRVTIYAGWVTPDVAMELESSGITLVELSRRRPYSPASRGPNIFAKLLFHSLDILETFIPSREIRKIHSAGHDVVHVHRFQGYGAGILAHPRVVHTMHDYAIVDTVATTIRNETAVDKLPLAQLFRTKLISRAVNKAGCLIVPNPNLAARHRSLGAILDEKKLRVIPHGWRLPLTSIVQAKPPSAVTKFLYLGKLTKAKGFDLLLDAWGSGIPNSALFVAGAGDLAQEVESRAGSNGIHFQGWLGDAERAKLLAEVDALVLPSLWPENFPLVVAEAIISSLPIVTTIVASPPLVSHGITGLVVEGTVEAIREAMEEIVNNPSKLATLKNGTKRAAYELDFELHLQRIVGIYEKMAIAAGPSHEK